MSSGPYRPQLDGVRAVAIALVVAYHLGDLSGGWIGVDVFFVLSGYLITSILLSSPGSSSAKAVGRFWGRRARRLLPAVLVMVAVVGAYAWLGGPGVAPSQLRAPGVYTLLYAANWQQILSSHDYFAAFTAPDPLQHTWSLAIEEQYYVVWPLLLGAITIAACRWSRQVRRTQLWVTGFLTTCSVVWMGFAAHLYGANRAYLGTDTRAWELLLGGMAAMAWPASRPGPPTRRWSALATTGLAVVAVGAASSGGPPAWIWDGGLFAIASAAVLLVVGATRCPDSPLGRLLASGPLRWLGLVSYGLYLWHWPVIVLMTATNTGFSGTTLLVLRLATMLAVAAGSYYLIERPLRRADWSRLARRLRLPAPAFAAGGVAILIVLTVVFTVGPARAGGAVGPAAAPRGEPSTAPQGITGGLAAGSVTPPYRVWVFGDSDINDASPGIQAALGATGQVSVVDNTSFGGWGLTTDPQWPADARAGVTKAQADIAIGTWSWDDTPAAADPGAYTRRLERDMATLLSPGYGIKMVVLIQFPQIGPSAHYSNWAKETEVQDAWDRDAMTAVEAYPGRAVYLSTSQLFDPGGRYFAWFPTASGGWVRARKIDNVHFCPFGAGAFGELITHDLTGLLHLNAMRPGWEFGAWTRNARYNDPLGSCPDDHPPNGYRGVPLPRST